MFSPDEQQRGQNKKIMAKKQETRTWTELLLMEHSEQATKVHCVDEPPQLVRTNTENVKVQTDAASSLANAKTYVETNKY